MRFADFIDANIEPTIAQWVAFARTLLPAARSMDYLALRDDAAEILKEIAADMRRQQNEGERSPKSQGLSVRDPTLDEAPFSAHATQRASSGFGLIQIVAEYRALRASVLRLWHASLREADLNDLEDVTRFNEAIDQALVESLKFYIGEVDRVRLLFLGVLGHDLRTPLGTVVNCANLQMRMGPDSARNGAMILRNTTRMQSLLDDLLAYVQKHWGTNIVVEPAPIQLDHLARDTLSDLSVVSKGRGIELEAKGNLEGRWDGRRLHQLLTNLIVNALKYGAPDRSIGITLDGTGGDIELAVHNFGTPIPPEILPGLFEPFVHGSAGATIEQLTGHSVGLGLYIAHEIVAAHGGTISVTSSEQHGTRFEARLPRGRP